MSDLQLQTTPEGRAKWRKRIHLAPNALKSILLGQSEILDFLDDLDTALALVAKGQAEIEALKTVRENTADRFAAWCTELEMRDENAPLFGYEVAQKIESLWREAMPWKDV